MNKILSLIAIALLCTATVSVAGKIYKWTDSEGNTHYGERPPSGQGQQMRVPKSPPPSAKPATSPTNQAEATQKLLDSFDKERKDKAEATEKAEKEQARLDRNCSNARKRMAGLNLGGRIYDITEQGERNYLSDADIQKRKTEASKAVEKWCK